MIIIQIIIKDYLSQEKELVKISFSSSQAQMKMKFSKDQIPLQEKNI